jgi:hypothetical protein
MGMLPGERLCHLGRAVGAAVLDDDDFCLERLRRQEAQDAGQAVGKTFLFVVGRKDDR